VIHEHSRGIPRTISVMCDHALVSGFALGRQPVDREILLEVSRDFHLHGNGNAGAQYGQLASKSWNGSYDSQAVQTTPVNESPPVDGPQPGAQVTPLARFRLFGGRRR